MKGNPPTNVTSAARSVTWWLLLLSQWIVRKGSQYFLAARKLEERKKRRLVIWIVSLCLDVECVGCRHVGPLMSIASDFVFTDWLVHAGSVFMQHPQPVRQEQRQRAEAIQHRLWTLGLGFLPDLTQQWFPVDALTRGFSRQMYIRWLPMFWAVWCVFFGS